MNGALLFWLAMASVLLASVFSTLRLSVRDLSLVRLEALLRAGDDRRARMVRRVLEDPAGHATATALPRMALHFVAVVAIVAWCQTWLPADAAVWVAPAIGIPTAAIVIWVIGIVIPQSIASHAAERVVYMLPGLLQATYILMMPLRFLVSFFDEVVRRLVGAPVNNGEEIAEELLSAVKEAELEGQFDQSESEMIGAVVKFRTTTADQIMTPRTEIQAFEQTDDLDEIKRLISESNHSRIPVYEDNLDHVAGVLYARDILLWMASDHAKRGEQFSLRETLRPAVFVPETKTIRELLKEMLVLKVHIAIVADEYGGTAGLVTIEDIVEEIFGEIQDEYETPADEPPVITVDNAGQVAEADARVHIDDANELLEAIGIELPESEEYDTVGGFVLTALGRIPEPGETVRHENAMVTVLEAEPTRVGKVRIEMLPELTQDRKDAEAGNPAQSPGS